MKRLSSFFSQRSIRFFPITVPSYAFRFITYCDCLCVSLFSFIIDYQSLIARMTRQWMGGRIASRILLHVFHVAVLALFRRERTQARVKQIRLRSMFVCLLGRSCVSQATQSAFLSPWSVVTHRIASARIYC